jgi:hypothetical protein
MKRIKRHSITLLAGLLIGLVGGVLIARPTTPERPRTPRDVREDAEKMNEDTDKWLAGLERDLEEEENR